MEEAEGAVETEWELIGSPTPARPWRYGIIPAAVTTTVALCVEGGTGS